MTDGFSLQRAEVLVDLGRHAEARDLVRLHLASTPDDAGALRLYAQCCLALGDPTALSAARAAIRLEPDDPGALSLAALAAGVQKRVRSSREFADAAVALAPESFETQFCRAQIEVFSVWPSKAGIEAARAAVRLGPDDSAAHRVLGELLKRTGKASEGIPYLREALRLDPNDAAAHAAIGTRELETQRLGRAAERFATAAALNPTDARAAHNLGAVAGRVVRNVHLVLILACLGLLEPNRGATTMRVVAILGCVVAVAVTWLMGRRLNRAVHGRSAQLFGTALRRDRLLAGWASLLGIGLVALVLVAVLPSDDATPWRVVVIVAVAVLASAVRLIRFLRGRSEPKPVF